MFKFNRIFFIITNFLISYFIFLLIYLLRYVTNIFSNIDKRELDLSVLIIFSIYSMIIILFNISLKIYEINKIYEIKESLILNIFISLISISVIGGFYFFTKLDFPRFVFFSGFLIIPFILSLWNKFLFYLISYTKRPYRIFYIGSDDNLNLLLELINNFKKWLSVEIIKLDLENIEEIKKNQADFIIIDTDFQISDKSFEILNEFEVNGGRIYTLVDIFAYFDQSLPAEIIKNKHFELFSAYKLDSFYNKYIKRIGDIISSLILIILTSPIMFIVAFLIKITSKGNVIYKQKRVGLLGKEFNMLKFRSMRIDAEKDGVKLTKENDNRITFIGKIIRPLRIDELPQLFNILKGDMSFIGPRPERKEIIEKIIKTFPLFKKRLLVKPGLTGWAQVKYTYVNNIEKMNKKLSYDLYYINNLSLLFDIKIVLYTIETVIFRRGAI